MDTAPVLQIDNVSKRYGGRPAVRNVSFDVRPGEIFGFLGPNGAGKTTTIKMALGLLSIDSGDIFINGISVKKDFESAIARVGGIIENPELYGYLSGLDNLRLFGRMNGNIPKKRIDEVVELVGLQNRIKSKVKTYSLGMRQRLGLAQALLHRPNLLVLDEPANGLDPAGIKEIRDNLRSLAQHEGLAVMVSSHILSEMQLMCDRVGIVDKGMLIGTYDINDLENGSEQSVYRFNVQPVQRAVEIARAALPDSVKEIAEKHIDVAVNEAEAAALLKQLALSDVTVTYMAPVERSLEDIFMSVTGKSQIQ